MVYQGALLRYVLQAMGSEVTLCKSSVMRRQQMILEFLGENYFI